MPLYGGGLGEYVDCVVTVAAATATGAMRMVGDRHRASDVLTGATFGVSAGYLIPALVHYRVETPPGRSALRDPPVVSNGGRRVQPTRL